MGQLIPWIQVTISGFVYVSAVFFLLLSLAHKYDLSFKDTRYYLPYIGILLIFLSYVIGYSAHLVFEKILFCLNPEYKLTLSKLLSIRENMSDILYKSYNDSYSNLVMFRHLVIATVFLGFSLYNWFRKSRMQKFKYYALITCFLFTMIFLIAYLMKRDDIISVKNAFNLP